MLIHFDNDKFEVKGGITNGSVLSELDLTSKKLKNVYYGAIISVDKDHVLVDFGAEKAGVLPIKSILPEHLSAKSISVGNNILVQVIEESEEVILTTFVCLSGSYFNFFPQSLNRIDNKNFTFPKFQADELFYELNLDLNIKIINGTEGKSQEELEWDLEVLMHHWQAIKDATLHCKPAILIHENSNPISDIIKMLSNTEVTELYIDDLKPFESMKKHLHTIGSKVKVFLYEEQGNILSSHKYIDWETVKSNQKRDVKKSVFKKIFSIFGK
jgi:ribonuclease E